MTDLLDAIARLDSAVIYLVVFALALGETAVFADMFVPGEVGLLVASAAAAQADLPFVPLWIAAAIGATGGDTVSYLLGRRFGARAAESRWMRRHAGSALERALGFVQRHGGGAVFLGRWVGALRAVVPLVAGSARMPFGRFLPFNVAASLTWGGAVVLLGYHLGPRAARWIDRTRWGLLALGAVVLVAWVVAARRKGRRRLTV